MTAVLSKNRTDGGTPPFAKDLFAQRLIRCSLKNCDVKYTLATGLDENRVTRGGVLLLDTMELLAEYLVRQGHPNHDEESFLWNGLNYGWERKGYFSKD
jgi:hypothetical protein